MIEKNKKIIIIGLVLLILGICGFILWNNRTVSTITLEINPSVEIRLNKNNKVIKVVPLNDDAKNIVKGNFYGKNLEETINTIGDNIIDGGYVRDDEVPILLYSDRQVDNDKVISILSNKFEGNRLHATIIVIDNVTKADKKIAKKHNISVARAAYINEMIKENKNLVIEDLTDKPVWELRDSKNSGMYCESGYTLEGGFCLKETDRINAKTGKVCPKGYIDHDGKCYSDVGATETDELECPEGFKLTDNECNGKEVIEATPNFTCNNGEPIERGRIPNRNIRDVGDPNEYFCEDRSNAKYPTERCYQQEHAIINGRCAMGPKPLLPTPTGCEGHDINYNGGCYDPYPSEPYICPNGDRFDTNTELCVDTFTYTKAAGNYSCETGYTLDGNKCTKDVTFHAGRKMICPDGTEKLDNGRCINKSIMAEYVDGYLCDEPDSRLDGNKCIIYEVIEVKR